MEARTSLTGARWMRYCIRPVAIAGFFVYLTFLCTLLLQRIFPYPFLFLFLGAVMASGWFGGAIAGALSVVFSTLVVAFFFVPPYYSFTISAAAESYFVSFVVCATLVSWLSAYRRKVEDTVRDARDHLEQRVHERTAELERSNRELQESERALRELTEALPQQIWRAGSDGDIVYCNLHLLNFTGRTQEEMCGSRFLEVVEPEDRGAFVDAWSLAREAGTPLEGEWRILSGSGQYRWFLVRAVPQCAADGSVNCWYGTHIDMQDWKHAELTLAESQAQLAHATRVMSMAEVAASIAHEINQPLTAIVTNAYALQGWLKTANIERAQATSEKIVREGTHAGSVVSKLRGLFLKGEAVREAASINGIIRETMRILRDEAIRRHIRIQLALDLSLPMVPVDRVQMQQALLNLAANAMDALEGVAPEQSELLVESTRTREGDVLVRVCDRGRSIDPAIARRIFDSFFSTKPGGLGMGLSITRTIVEAHNGRLWVEPRQGGGSVFQFTIPVEP